MKILGIGERIEKIVSFNQTELDLFTELSQDLNPIHTEQYAKDNNLKGSIVQGMLAAMKFGQVLGTEFPGHGTINMERNISFLNPIYTGLDYKMIIELLDIDLMTNVGTLSLSIVDGAGKVCLRGKTRVKNTLVFASENYSSKESCIKQEILEIVKLPVPTYGKNVTLYDSLKNRRSKRVFRKDDINIQELSNILWAANGVTKTREGENGGINYFFTNPTASNHQEVEVYVFNSLGIYLYNPIENQLEQIKSGDFRGEIGNLPFFKKAPVSLLLVSNIHKMIHHKSEEKRTRYSNMDIGYVSQNIYLYCSANNLSTCACGLINFDRLNEILDSENTGKKAMLVHPVSIGKDYDNEPNK